MPSEIGSHGSGDIPQHPDTPPDHSVIIGHISDLQSSIRNIFKEAVGNAGLDVAQQKDLSLARLEEAFAEVEKAGSKLVEVDARYKGIDAEGRRQHWNAVREYGEAEPSWQSAIVFNDTIAQIRQARGEALHAVNASIQTIESELKDKLGNLRQVITETFRGIPEALAATEPGERVTFINPKRPSIRQWNPAEEAGLLDAKLVVARMDIEALREQLGQTASPTAERGQSDILTFSKVDGFDVFFLQTDSPTSDILPLGHIDLDAFLKLSPPWKQHTIGDVIRLYHIAEHEPDNVEVQEQLRFLATTLDDLPGDSALEKADDLCMQLDEYDHRGQYPSSWIQEQNGYLPEEDIRVRYSLLQFDLPPIFRNQRNNPS